MEKPGAIRASKELKVHGSDVANVVDPHLSHCELVDLDDVDMPGRPSVEEYMRKLTDWVGWATPLSQSASSSATG